MQEIGAVLSVKFDFYILLVIHNNLSELTTVGHYLRNISYQIFQLKSRYFTSGLPGKFKKKPMDPLWCGKGLQGRV